MPYLPRVLLRPCSSRYAAALTSPSARFQAQHVFQKRYIARTSPRAEERATQPQTPATESIELSAPVTYISESHDPWFNLSYEDWLLRNTPRDQPVLFLYRNVPCVVIGRNQNPWTETTPRKLKEISLPLVRRRSGGGTVYHDMGNTNFSIILPRLLFTRSHGAELVARAIREELGIDACGVNERNDVIIRDAGQEYKVSGSAYKIVQHRAYHHGTMLISSSLAELGKSLKSSSPNMQTKGIASHRSAVTTLNHHIPPPSSNPYLRNHPSQIKHDDFVRAITHEFERVYATQSASGKAGKKMEVYAVAEDGVKDPKVWKGVQELRSWEWQFGQTPEFSNEIQGDLSFGQLVRNLPHSYRCAYAKHRVLDSRLTLYAHCTLQSASIAARHARLTSISFSLTPLSSTSQRVKQEVLDALALSLVGKRYETLDGAEGDLGPAFEDGQARDLASEVITWLRRSM